MDYSYPVAAIASYGGLWCVVVSDDPLQVRLLYKRHENDPQDPILVEDGFLRPVSSHYVLDKPYFKTLERVAGSLLPGHNFTWVQKKEES